MRRPLPIARCRDFCREEQYELLKLLGESSLYLRVLGWVHPVLRVAAALALAKYFLSPVMERASMVGTFLALVLVGGLLWAFEELMWRLIIIPAMEDHRREDDPDTVPASTPPADASFLDMTPGQQHALYHRMRVSGKMRKLHWLVTGIRIATVVPLLGFILILLQRAENLFVVLVAPLFYIAVNRTLWNEVQAPAVARALEAGWPDGTPRKLSRTRRTFRELSSNEQWMIFHRLRDTSPAMRKYRLIGSPLRYGILYLLWVTAGQMTRDHKPAGLLILLGFGLVLMGIDHLIWRCILAPATERALEGRPADQVLNEIEQAARDKSDPEKW